jgi:hypothetical protein
MKEFEKFKNINLKKYFFYKLSFIFKERIILEYFLFILIF